MLRQRAKIVSVALLFADFIAVVAAFYASFFLRDIYLSQQLGPMLRSTGYPVLLYVSLPLWGSLLYFFSLYESQRTRSFLEESWKIVSASAIGTLLLMAGVFAIKAEFVSRIVVGSFGLAACLMLLAERRLVRLAAKSLRQQGYNSRNILLVGTGRRAREIADSIERNKQWGLRLLGYVSDNPDTRMTHVRTVPVLGTVADLPHLLNEHVVDELIFAVSRKKLEGLENLFLLCEEQGIRTRVAVNFFPHMIAKVHMEDFDGIPFLTFTTTPHNELRLMAKRLFDVGVSLLLLPLFLPLCSLIALGILTTSGGPVLFGQTRVGLNGRQFRLYKFRSMQVDAEQTQGDIAHLNEMDGPVFKMKNDPRVTPFGRFLRLTSMDELPQFYNVLMGDMSIVGPRPQLREEVAQYERWHRRRLSMKPGLTCLWQINGRNTITDFKKWIELDLHYIDNWSLKLDLKICARTLMAVLLGRGAS
jgi:exopolysaccharide biosynthesis polyprenyl glycosylphosphotransferase